MARRLTTIHDVAREAGVDASTVSRVLNGRARVLPATRERILNASEKLGYRPSRSARALRQSRTMTVGVVVPDMANAVFAQYLRGAEHGAQESDYSVMICDGQDSVEIMEWHLQRLYDQRVDGILLAARAPAGALEPFEEAGIPVEPAGFHLGKRGETHRARLQHQASVDAYAHLLDLGHQRFAYFRRRPSRSRLAGDLPRRRLRALTDALAQRGMTREDIEVVDVVDADDCRDAVARTLATEHRPTAWIAGSHLVAPWILQGIYQAGYSVPEDLSFVSYGDSDWAAAYRPPLAVIKHDYYAEARANMRRLVARMESHPEGPPPLLNTPSEFLPRGSCAPPPPYSAT